MEPVLAVFHETPLPVLRPSVGTPDPAIQRRLVDRLEAEPRVRGMAVADKLPGKRHEAGPVEVEGECGFPEDVARARVVPGFFHALDQPLHAGRASTRGMSRVNERP